MYKLLYIWQDTDDTLIVLFLKGITVGFNLTQITHFVPTYCHQIILEEQVIIFRVNSPYMFSSFARTITSLFLRIHLSASHNNRCHTC